MVTKRYNFFLYLCWQNESNADNRAFIYIQQTYVRIHKTAKRRTPLSVYWSRYWCAVHVVCALKQKTLKNRRWRRKKTAQQYQQKNPTASGSSGNIISSNKQRTAHRYTLHTYARNYVFKTFSSINTFILLKVQKPCNQQPTSKKQMLYCGYRSFICLIVVVACCLLVVIIIIICPESRCLFVLYLLICIFTYVLVTLLKLLMIIFMGVYVAICRCVPPAIR